MKGMPQGFKDHVIANKIPLFELKLAVSGVLVLGAKQTLMSINSGVHHNFCQMATHWSGREVPASQPIFAKLSGESTGRQGSRPTKVLEPFANLASQVCVNKCLIVFNGNSWSCGGPSPHWSNLSRRTQHHVPTPSFCLEK